MNENIFKGKINEEKERVYQGLWIKGVSFFYKSAKNEEF